MCTAAGVIALQLLYWIIDRPAVGIGGNVSAAVNADLERVENLIIIEGLNHETEPAAPSGEGDTQGKIIIDNSFVTTQAHDAPVSSKNSAVETQKSAPETHDADREWKALKRKDKRWHLTEYTIRRGDNLWGIAQRFDTDHRLIISINNITKPDMLRAGKRIKVPNKGGIFHRIEKGDTLSEIARTYRVGQSIIMVHNNISDSKLQAGSRIFIPGGKANVQAVRTEPREPGPQRESRHNTVIREPKHVAASPVRQEQKKITRTIASHPRRSFSWPLRGKITSAFGSRTNPLTRRRSFHSGIDIGAPVGTPVSASADGKVIFSGWKDIYGNMIILKHDDGFITVYAHNKKNLVSENDMVTRGDTIALSGMTGFVTGPHLHYEIRKHLTPLNPGRFLR